jgi:hypothetical protein
MVEQKKIHHVNRKGYKLMNYKFDKSDPSFQLFEIYKRITDRIGLIFLRSTGSIDKMGTFDEFEEELEYFEENYEKLIEQGILEKKQYFPEEQPYLSVNYQWAEFHNICPICLENIYLYKPHFELEFEINQAGYIHFVKTHTDCVINMLDRHNLKKDYEDYDPFDIPDFKRFDFEEVPHDWIGFNCPYCGLSLDLYELFFDRNGSLSTLYNKLNFSKDENNVQMIKKMFKYIQNLSRELFGRLSILNWAMNIKFTSDDEDIRLVLKYIVIYEGRAYHPYCALKEKREEEQWKEIAEIGKNNDLKG